MYKYVGIGVLLLLLQTNNVFCENAAKPDESGLIDNYHIYTTPGGLFYAPENSGPNEYKDSTIYYVSDESKSISQKEHSTQSRFSSISKKFSTSLPTVNVIPQKKNLNDEINTIEPEVIQNLYDY
jgi:hypothetical protein